MEYGFNKMKNLAMDITDSLGGLQIAVDKYVIISAKLRYDKVQIMFEKGTNFSSS